MPDRYQVRITRRASDDIIGVCTYIQQRSPQNAVAVAQSLIDAIDALDIFPHRYKLHVSHADSAKRIHSMPVPPFIVYYRVLERH